MLNDKYSYYQREHSEKLIASICLMSVCVYTCGEGSDFGCSPREGGSYVTVNRQLELLGVSQEILGTQIFFLRTAWHPHQRIPQ